MDDWTYALGEGWLKALAVGVIGAIGAWLLKGPLAKAGLIEAVEKSVKNHMGRLDAEIERLEQARITDNEDCDRRLAEQKAMIDALMEGRVAAYVTADVDRAQRVLESRRLPSKPRKPRSTK